MEGNREKRRGIFLTLAGGMCWGISGCFGQFLFQEKGATANWLVSIRLLTAGILLLIIGYIHQGKKLNEVFHKKADAKKLLGFSVFGMLFCQYTYFAAVQYSNAGTATVLQALAPTVILAFVCIRNLKLPKGFELTAVISAVLGVFLLSTHGNIHNMMLTKQALFFGLASAIGAASYNLLAADLLRGYGVYVVVGFGMFFGGLVLCAIVRPWNLMIPLDGETLLALFG